jgi:unsaturated chondroitin disaccharide hydrolase
MKLEVNDTLDRVRAKMAAVCERSRGKIPSTTVKGVHDDCAHPSDPVRTFQETEGIFWWTNGFWAGINWLLYHDTKEERYADIARYTEEVMDKCFDGFYGLHHDVGFMLQPSAVADFKLTGNADSRRRAMHAANLLAGRYNPAGRFIRAWNEHDGADVRGWAIIDCLMNLSLLYWASEDGNDGVCSKDPRFRQIAMLHCDTALERFLRPDGSVNHIVEFNPETGAFVKTYGGQGYAEGSTWSRGQAWALYGFCISSSHTRKTAYLDAAKSAAHYFIANIPSSGLVPVDFRQPPEPAWEDSTAAAIAASGLLEIARQVGEREADMYRSAALRLLDALVEQRCDWSADTDCILTHCCSAYHDKEHDVQLVYADYFFIEALYKLAGGDYFMW